jgi:2-oxoglutarate dehydrogenase E2 component (dihydrolipoamide succinyltransferase)
MPVELKVPSAGESIAEVEIAEWLKKEGDAITPNDDLVMLDSAKTTLPLASPVTGTLKQILKQQGEVVAIGEVIALLEEGAPAATEATAAEPAVEWNKEATPAAAAEPAKEALKPAAPAKSSGNGKKDEPFVMPAAAREMAQSGVEKSEVTPTGPGGRILKEDVQNAQSAKAERAAAESIDGERTAPVDAPKAAPKPAAPAAPKPAASKPAPLTAPTQPGAGEEVVPMTMLRRHIAQRLVEAQQNAALLTTFNEVNMSAVMEMRKQFQDDFTKKHGIKLGFMSFFVKASVEALKAYPSVNAEIRGRDLVYKNFYDIGVAIGGGKGLVVPVLRDAEHMGFAAIEKQIAEYAGKAKDGTLKPEDLEGGTFTITNGGIYGSLMSTPIINPPQSGILGMHAIQERPVAENGQVVIRPMMYLALTYDHRIIDGREAVSFLVRIKQSLENPARLLLEV